MKKPKKLDLSVKPEKDFTLQFEHFPDGVYGVPLVLRSNGPVIGSAVVTFKDASWDAVIQLNAAGARELGVALTFEEDTLEIPMRQAKLVAKPWDEEY